MLRKNQTIPARLTRGHISGRAPKCALFLTFYAVLSLAFCHQCRAQDFLSWVDDQAVMAGVVQNLASVKEELNDYDRWGNKYWDGVIALLNDERFPVLTDETREQLESIREAAFQAMDAIDEIGFIVHEIDESSVQATVLLRLSNDSVDKSIEKELTPWLNSVTGGEQFGNAWLRTSLNTLSFTRANDWLLVSNNPSEMAEVAKRIGGESHESFRSMRQSRRFQLAEANASSVAKGSCILTLYGNPDRMRRFFSKYSDAEWDSFKINEMPSFGLQVYLSQESRSEDRSPWLVVDCAIQHTLPRSGFGKFLDSYRPLNELPEFPDPPTWCRGEFFDPEKRFEARKLLYENQSEREFETYEELVVSQYRSELFTEVPTWLSTMADSSFEMVFYPPNVVQPRVLILRSVLSEESAQSYAEAIVNRSNNRKNAASQKYTEVENPFGWMYSEQGDSDPNRNPTSIFVNDKWLMQGDSRTILQMAEAPVDGEEFTGGKTLEEMIRSLELRARVTGQTFKFEYSCSNAEKSRFRYIEDDLIMNRIKKQFDGQQFNQEVARTAELPENEHGFRAELETVEDRDEVLRMLLLLGFTESLGDRITLFSQRPDQLRVTRGFFRTESSEIEESSK